jgi:dephospho-CoA kinase
MKVIGVIGLNGSGKDEVVNYLNRRYGTPLISVGDIVREIAAREGVESTRDNLDAITKKCFAQYGEGYFLKQVIEKIRRQADLWKDVGISGIRSPQDVNLVRQAFGKDFFLVHVFISDDKVRFARIRRRSSQRDNATLEEFIRQDQVSEQLFHIQEAIKMADYSISNDGTLEDLQREIEKLIKIFGY